MKSKHLAKADFLRQLRSLARDLYLLGDFTCKDPERALLASKLQGYVEAGITIEVVTSSDVQNEIDKAHREQFGEERAARRERLLAELSKDDKQESDSEPEDITDWEYYDAPARDRQEKRKRKS